MLALSVQPPALHGPQPLSNLTAYLQHPCNALSYSPVELKQPLCFKYARSIDMLSERCFRCAQAPREAEYANCASQHILFSRAAKYMLMSRYAVEGTV